MSAHTVLELGLYMIINEQNVFTSLRKEFSQLKVLCRSTSNIMPLLQVGTQAIFSSGLPGLGRKLTWEGTCFDMCMFQVLASGALYGSTRGLGEALVLWPLFLSSLIVVVGSVSKATVVQKIDVQITPCFCKMIRKPIIQWGVQARVFKT